MFKKTLLFFSLLLSTCLAFAQADTIQTHGTIKITKPQKEVKIYIKASMNFDNYDFTRKGIYPPFPGVEGYTYPFNYTRYFTEKFKNKEIDLRGKTIDTVRISIKVLENGKVYLKDQTLSVLLQDLPTNYDEKVQGIEISRLQLDCITFLKQIKSWESAYTVTPKQGTFKKQTVIKPEIKQIKALGVLTIIFSQNSLED